MDDAFATAGAHFGGTCDTEEMARCAGARRKRTRGRGFHMRG